MNAKNLFAKEYGITEMLKDMRKKYNSRMIKLASSNIDWIDASIKEHGTEFGTLYDAEKNNTEGAANTSYMLHVKMMQECVETWEPVKEKAKGSPRMQCITFYEDTLEMALFIQAKHNVMMNNAVHEKLAAKRGSK